MLLTDTELLGYHGLRDNSCHGFMNNLLLYFLAEFLFEPHIPTLAATCAHIGQVLGLITGIKMARIAARRIVAFV